MSRIYTVTFENVALTAANTDVDLFEIRPADDKPCKVLAVTLANVGPDVGDAEEEMLRLEALRGHTTSGSGGATPTPAPLNPSDAAAGFAADTMNPTIASVTTPISLHSDGWNVRVPYLWVAPPKLEWHVNQGNTTLVFRMHSTVADTVQVSGTIYVEELG